MKRLILAFVLVGMLASTMASARVAVIVDRSRTETLQATSLPAMQRNATDLARSYVTGYLDRANPGSYDVFSIDQVKTEWARTGLIFGTQYAAVIWAGYFNVSAGQNVHASCYPCSLTLSARAPTVPQLFVDQGTQENHFANSVSCSTGFGGDSNDPGGQGPYFGSGMMQLEGSPWRWRTVWCTAARGGSVPAGKWRPIIGGTEARSVGSVLPVDRDSILAIADITAAYGQSQTSISYVVMRYMNHVNGASPVIFCRWGQSALTMMGGAIDPDDQHNNGTPLPIWASIALLDSLAGRAVLGSNPRVVRIGVQVSGLCARGGTSGLRSPGDTTAAYASLDSLKKLGVPLDFGVNLDSMAVYPSDVRYAKAIGLAKFAPENLCGASSGSAGLASRTRPLDLFGAARARTFFSPIATSARDTAVNALAAYSVRLIDSVFTHERRSRIAMPPGGDWSPFGMTPQAAVGRDSLLYALSGYFAGLSYNIEQDTLTTSSALYPVGLPPHTQSVATSPISAGARFSFVGYPGTLGGTEVYDLGDNENTLYVHDYVTRVLRGAVMGFWKQPQRRDLYPNSTHDANMELRVSARARLATSCNVARVSMAQMAGGSADSPARPGFYTIKYLNAYCRAVNALGGRTLFEIVPVSSLGPDDFKR